MLLTGGFFNPFPADAAIGSASHAERSPPATPTRAPPEACGRDATDK